MIKLLLITFAISGLVLGGCTSTPTPAPTTSSNTTTTNVTAATTPGESTPVAAATTPAADAGDGETVIMEAVGLTYKIPAGWKKNPNGALESPDGAIGVALIEPADGEAKAVIGKLGTVLEALMTDVKVTGDETSHEVNGINSFYVQGTGKLKEGGKEVEWAVEIMKAKKVLVLLEFFEPGAYEKQQPTFDAFEGSFTAIEGGETPEASEGTETPEATGTPDGE